MFVVGEDRATPKQAAKVNLDLQPLEKEAEESPIPAPPETEEHGNPTEHAAEQHTVSAIQDTQAHQEMLEDNKRMAQFIQKMKERNKVLQTALETAQAKLDEHSRDLAATTQQKESFGQALEKLRAELNQRDQEANQHQETRKQLEAQISDLRTQLEDALKPRLSVPKSIKILPGRDMTPILLDELARTEGELDRVKQDYIRAIDDNQRQNALIDELGNQIKVTNGIAERLIRLEDEHSAKIAQYERLKSQAISPDAYSTLEQALRKSEANLHIKSEEIAALQYSQRKLEADLRERDGTINELTNTLQSIQTKKQDLLYELLETGEKNTRQDKEIQFERARWKEENRNLEFEIEKLRIELKTLLAKTVEHEADQAKLRELERQLQLAQTQKAELNEELSAKIGQLSTIQNQLTEQKIQISKLNYIKESHQALLTRASELESKLIDTEAARSVLKHEVAYLKQKEDTSQLLRESLLQRVKDAEEAHSKKLAEIDSLKKLLTEKEAEIVAVRHDLGLVGNKYEEMIKTVSKEANNPVVGTEPSVVTDGFKSIKNSGTEAGDDLKSEVQLLKMRNSQLLLEIQKLKDSLEQLQSASSPREVALKAAEAQITEMKRENTLLAKKLLEKSGEVKELKEKEAKLLQELQTHLNGQQEAGDLKQQIAALNAELSTLRQKGEEISRLHVLLSEKEGTLSSLRMSLAHQQSKMAALEQANKGSPMDSPTLIAAPGLDPQIRVLQSKLKAAQDRLAEQEEELSKALRRESSVKEEATLEQERLKDELTRMKTISASSLGSSGNPDARELSEKLAELNDKYELAQAKLSMMDEIAEENERLRTKLANLEAKTQ